MTRPIELPVYLSPATLRVLSVQQILADLAQTGEQPGAVLRSLADGRTQVRIGARTVDLELAQRLEPGTRFLARLVHGRLLLHLLPPTGRFALHQQVFEPGLRQPALEITVRSLVQTLQDLGLPADPAHIGLAQAILLAGLPITRELLRRLQRELGTLSDAEVDALGLVLRKRIPFDRSLVEKMGAVLQARGRLDEVLRALLNARQNLPDLPSAAGVRDALARLDAWAEARSLPGSGDQLGEWVRDSGVFWEGNLLRGEAAGNDLKGLAASLYHALRAVAAEDGTGLLAELQAKTAHLIDLITRQQLIDLDEPFAQDRIWCVEIPVRVDGETTSLQLLVREEGKREKERERSLEVQLRIHLSRLGQVVGLLSHLGDRLVVRLGTDSPTAREVIKENLPALEAALSDLDYSFVRVTSRDPDS